jgi:hypothetical protein
MMKKRRSVKEISKAIKKNKKKVSKKDRQALIDSLNDDHRPDWVIDQQIRERHELDEEIDRWLEAKSVTIDMDKPQAKSDLRPVGDITQDMEELLFELTEGHQLQHGEVLALIFSWLQIHAPDARETYTEDDSHPEFYYGPKK